MNRNRLCAGLAFIIADICILCLANTNTKKDSDKTKAYQEPSSASSSICSKYVKEETEFEQHLVTPEETKETNTDVINTNNDQNTITDGYDAYYNKYIAYVNSAKFENKFYLFNVDSENKICTEVNGLMTLDIYDLIQYNPIIVFDALTDEEKQLFPSNKNVKTIEETEENLKKIRTPQEIIDDLNKKYFHKNDEEILSQLKEDGEIQSDGNTVRIFANNNSYPFDISYTYDKTRIDGEYKDDESTPNAGAKFSLNVNWDYKGNGTEDENLAKDVLDTKFGKDAYKYYQNGENDSSKAIEIVVKITTSMIKEKK